MIGRADIEGSKSNVAMSGLAATSQLSLCFKFRRSKGSIGHAFTVRIRTENQNQTSFYPFVPHEISVLVELILGHLRYLLTDVPPQPNSPPDNVLRPDRPAEASLGSKRRGCYPASIHGLAVRRPKKLRELFPVRPPADTRRAALAALAARAVRQQSTGSELGSSSPALRANPFPEVTDPFCRLPLPTLFHRPEAVHLGDLMRL
ncbi:hypothetical protein Bca101_102097 [Brassica carinata]